MGQSCGGSEQLDVYRSTQKKAFFTEGFDASAAAEGTLTSFFLSLLSCRHLRLQRLGAQHICERSQAQGKACVESNNTNNNNNNNNNDKKVLSVFFQGRSPKYLFSA